MGLFNKSKNKKTDNKAPKEENVLDMVKEPVADKAALTPTAPKDNTGRAHRVLHHHHLSEKTNTFAGSGRYVFKIAVDANKIEVKKAIEAVYEVHVTAVNIMNVVGKNRRQGRTRGRTQDWKKAIVTLKSGEKISGLAEGV